MPTTNTLTIVTEAIAEITGTVFNASDPLPVSLTDDLDMESLEIVEVVMSIEGKLGISISDDEIAEIKTVGDLVKLIDQYR